MGYSGDPEEMPRPALITQATQNRLLCFSPDFRF